MKALVVSILAIAPLASAQPKIAVMETAFGKRADASSFADAKEAGYSAMQMHSGQPSGLGKGPIDPSLGLAIGSDPTILESWQKASAAHGVEIISLCAGSLNKCQIWDRDREVAMRIAKQTIDGCHTLGLKTMLFPFFGPSKFQDSDEALNGVAGFMKELLPYAEKKDVVIGIEAPVTTERLLELMELCGFPEHLKIYYDTGNLFKLEDIYETIRKHGGQHFCEIHIKASNHAVAGEGDIDLQKLATALDEARYDGWLVYEANRNGKEPFKNHAAIVELVSLRQQTAPKIAEPQTKWIEVYKKQANIPKPEAMLINNDAEPDLSTNFVALYNGKDLEGWTPRGGHCKFEAKGDTLVGTCVPGSPSTYLSTNKDDYTDFVFTAELKWAVDGNTGIMFRAASKPGKKKGTETVFGPQAEMEAFSKERYWSGGIYGQSAGGWIYPMWLDAHEAARTSMKRDGWNRITIEAKGDTIKTWLNGAPAAHWKTDEYKRGFFSLQIHSGKAGEVHFRNLKVKELGEPKKAAATKPASKKPNFIFVLSDDVAQGDLGCYGQELIQTPRLDQLAAEGTRYLQAYCGTSVCAPSRSSFFTGLHSGHCPVRGNYELPPEGQFPLPDKTVTIAEVAKSAGYATSTFGKWGMGFFDTSGAPAKQGVDHFFGYNCQRHAHSYFPTYLYDDNTPFILPGNDGQGVGETYSQELIQNDMIKWLRAKGDEPFMMFYAITLPHGPHEIDKFGVYADKPWSNKQKSYAAQVTRIDSDIGEMVDTLRELGIAENTCVIFSGDNGSSFAPNSEIGKLFDQASNGLRGFKRGMYEGALRQAAFAWWPGTVPAGRVDSQPWAFWDLMPTFVELSGATPPKGYETDGLSLVNYLKGGDAPERDYFYWELHLGNRPVQAARWGDWKAVRKGFDKPIEIYDLAKDAGETNNLAAAKRELVAKAERIFKDAHRPSPDWPLTGRDEKHTALSKKAWEIKRKRDKDKWVPPNAVKKAS